MIEKIKEKQMEILIGILAILLLGGFVGGGGRNYEYKSVNAHQVINLQNMQTQLYGVEEIDGENEVKVIFHFITDPIEGENVSVFPFVKIYNPTNKEEVLYSSFLKTGEQDIEVLFLKDEYEKLETLNLDYYTISTEEELEYSTRKSYSIIYKNDIYKSVSLANMLVEDEKDIDKQTKEERLDFIQKRYFTSDKLKYLNRKEAKELNRIFKKKINKAYEDLLNYLIEKKEEAVQFYEMLHDKEITDEEISIAIIDNNFTKTKENLKTLNELGNERLRDGIALLKNKLLYNKAYTEEEISALIKNQDNIKSFEILQKTYIEYLEKEAGKSDKNNTEKDVEYITRLEGKLKIDYPNFEEEERKNNIQNVLGKDTNVKVKEQDKAKKEGIKKDKESKNNEKSN